MIMQTIDKIIFGDNQFFGINHMSQEKAQQLAEKFFDINAIYRIYDIVFETGIKAVMLNSNDRAKDICNYFLKNKNKYQDITWYPSIPYPYKYANLVAEKGIFPAINEILFKDNTAKDMLNMLTKGSMAVLGKDVIKMMQMLIDIEMKIFKGLNVKVIFLQNIITDLLLGYGIRDLFFEYCEYIRKKYNILPGLITQNLPFLLKKLEEWKINEVVLCTSYNKIGYLMSPDVETYIEIIRRNDPKDYQIVAMSTLASGAIPVNEAYNFINQQNIQAVVFGASDRKHIEETIKLINI
jgi:phage anti-repressor protein